MSATLNEAIGANQNSSHSKANADNKSCSNGQSEANMAATNLSDSSSISFCKQNKLVIDAIALVNNLITRLTNNNGSPMFYFNAFFLTPLASTSIRAGFTYAGLAKDSSLNLEPSFITTWHTNHCNFRPLLKELKNFQIPEFKLPHSTKHFKACTTITSQELVNTFYFPTTDSKIIPSTSTPSKSSPSSSL